MKYQKFEFKEREQAEELRDQMITAGSAVSGPLQFILETSPGEGPEDPPKVLKRSGFCLDVLGSADIPIWAHDHEVRPENPLHSFAGHIYNPLYDQQEITENPGE
jgi:hypothetical protein